MQTATKKSNKKEINARPAKLLDAKLEALAGCLKDDSHEDAAGHLCDLLELCRQRIVSEDKKQRPIFKNLKKMVKHYGKDPEPIEV